jgi:hypothetical protein
MVMKNHQLEITLPPATCRTASLRQRRITRARWWFSQMRRVVEEAAPAQSAEPEQASLPLAQRR